MRLFKTIIPLFLCFALLLTACTLDSELLPSDSPIVTTASPADGTDFTDVPSNTPSDTEPSDSPSDTETSLPPPEDTKPTEGTTPTEPVTSPTIPKDSSFEVHFIDVGQADAALILCDGEAALIDGGNASDSSLSIFMDHVGGLAGALNAASVGTALCSVKSHDSKVFSNFVKAVEKHNKSITIPKVGHSFDIGSADAVVLGPVSSSTEPNNMSLVIRIDYGQTSFLFTGDAEYEEETEILNATHPNQKPVAVCEYFIQTYTNPGDRVLDSCMGSGSAGVACINTDREFIGIEIKENIFIDATLRIEAANKQKKEGVHTDVEEHQTVIQSRIEGF